MFTKWLPASRRYGSHSNTSNSTFNVPVSSAPVSYTHLDVYKRQLRGRDPRPGSGWNSLAFARSPCASGVALGVHAGLCPPSAGKAARVKSGGGPPAFLPRRRTCRKVPRPETGRPRHARAFLFLVFRSGYNNAPQLCISTKPMPSISFMSLSGRMNDAL